MAKSGKGDLLEKLVPILLVSSVALAFAVGILWEKVNNLEGGGRATTGTQVGTQPQDAGNQVAPQAPPQGKLSEEQAGKIPEIVTSDHIRGNADSEITVIEYSDFECPFCARFHPTMKQVMDEYGDQVKWVYRHFPLDQIHPKARPAAIASECVARLGGEDAFWKFADAVFEDQTKLSDLSALARSVDVSGSSYENCINDEIVGSIVEEQYQGGIGAGITGTPGNFILNSKGEAWLIPGALPFEQIKATIDEALQS